MKRIIDISEQLYATCIRLNNEEDARPSVVCIANSLPYEEKPQGDMSAKEYNVYLEGYKQGKKDFEKPQGYWKLIHPLQADDDGAYCCSVCGNGGWGIDPERDKYCYNCGAKMRGEE
jgi:hypothetical protein